MVGSALERDSLTWTPRRERWRAESGKNAERLGKRGWALAAATRAAGRIQAMRVREETPGPEELWSWVDRGDPRVEAHLAAHPEDEPRVAAWRAAIGAVRGREGAPPERIGPYEVVRVLGEGAMGIVYEAVQPNPRRRVALKVLRRERGADAQGLERFTREAAVLARLAHPGIATIHEAGRLPDGTAYLVMELVEGLTLLAHAREKGLDRGGRVELVQRVCMAVQHAHARGVVHRDLKPSNVLVEDSGRPKVLDFGLARLTGAEGGTLSGSVLGTPAYMSPEQARGVGAGPASDVYALGVMLHELLTGALPIEVAGATLVEAVRRVASDPPRRPASLVPGIERGLEAVLLRCLEKDPARRYADAGALADELGRWLRGEPVLARPPGTLELARRYARRHRVGVLSSLAIGLLAALALFVALFPARLPWSLSGDWWREGSAFDELRWRGDTPEVALDARWYELETIEGLNAAYVAGFCRQHSDARWRKRFSEDLVQVLNRMGAWCFFEVDLELRDLETGERVLRHGVPLDRERRDRIRNERYRWPFQVEGAEADRPIVSYLGRRWRLLSVEGIDAARLDDRLLYDALCDRTGRSPRPRIDFVLEALDTGQRTEFRAVPRDATASLAEREGE
jgi:hypothetical protein